MHRKIAVMCTGGMDSTTLLYLLHNEGFDVIPLTINYGQVAFNKQVELINYHLNKLHITNSLVEIPVTYQQASKGLYTPGFVPTKEDGWNAVRYSEFLIEGRNAIMLLYASAYCSSNRIPELLTGYVYSKEEWDNMNSVKLLTGDNSPRFVDAINCVLQYGFSNSVRIRAPFYEQRYDKKKIVQLGKLLGVDYAKTYSCYFIPECGKCDNCIARKEALYE